MAQQKHAIIISLLRSFRHGSNSNGATTSHHGPNPKVHRRPGNSKDNYSLMHKNIHRPSHPLHFPPQHSPPKNPISRLQVPLLKHPFRNYLPVSLRTTPFHPRPRIRTLRENVRPNSPLGSFSPAGPWPSSGGSRCFSTLNSFALRGSNESVEESTKRFVVTVLQNNIDDKTLGLPSKFVSEYGDELSDIVKLIDPKGHVWLVDLTKGKNNVWFDGDWDEFVKYHSIGDRYKLVFKYKGKYKGISNFSVFIFDGSSCEIPYLRNEPSNEVAGLTDSEDDVNEHETNDIDVALQGIITSQNFTSQYMEATMETKRAVKKACASKPKNGSFLVILHVSNVQGGTNLYVPVEFTRKYLQDPGKYIKFQLSDGKEYSVGIYQENHATRVIRFFTSRWLEFVRDNDLKIGDVCLFELVPSSAPGIVLKASIFRASDFKRMSTIHCNVATFGC